MDFRNLIILVDTALFLLFVGMIGFGCIVIAEGMSELFR